MQPLELAALAIAGLWISLVLLPGGQGAAINRGRKAVLGGIVGLVTALVVLVPQVDVWPDSLQRPAELLLIIVVTAVLIAARAFQVAGGRRAGR